MPRVNRDLQRRMAARRERERRRPPTERSYRVETDATVEDAAEAEQLDGSPEMAAAAATTTATARPSSAVRQSAAKVPPRPFSDYRAEYAYVGTDLRRVAIVIGSLLVVLILLHFLIAR